MRNTSGMAVYSNEYTFQSSLYTHGLGNVFHHGAYEEMSTVHQAELKR